MSVRGADKDFKKYVLNEGGYEWLGSEYKRKSRLHPRTIYVTTSAGKKMKKVVDEKQVIFYSEKYDKRAKAERAAGYVKNTDYDKKTGEILASGKALALDLEKLKEEEALD